MSPSMRVGRYCRVAGIICLKVKQSPLQIGLIGCVRCGDYTSRKVGGGIQWASAYDPPYKTWRSTPALSRGFFFLATTLTNTSPWFPFFTTHRGARHEHGFLPCIVCGCWVSYSDFIAEHPGVEPAS